MDAVVFGAAGFCGQQVASQALSGNKYENVICLYRNRRPHSDRPETHQAETLSHEGPSQEILSNETQSKAALEANRLQTVSGCLTKLNLTEIFPLRPHVIFHFATSKDNFKDNLDSCRRIAQSINSFCRGIVFGSSLSVYGDGPHNSVSETAKLNPQTELARNRADCEVALRQVEKVPVVCLRPRMIIGKEDRYFLPKIEKLFRRGMTMGNEKQRISLIEVGDYAKVALQLGTLLSQNPDSLLDAYNVAYESPISILELRQILAPNQRIYYRIPVGISLGLFRWLPFQFAKRLSTKISLIGRDQTLDCSRLSNIIGKEILGQPVTEKIRNVLEDHSRLEDGLTEGRTQ